MTTRDEVGRRRKVLHDVLGRATKVQILDIQPKNQALNEDAGSIYSTTANIYNALDQVTEVRRHSGASESTAVQVMTMTYDGLGRLASRKMPEQSAATTFTYTNQLDGMLVERDGRGAGATYSYNKRGLVTKIDYNDSTNWGATSDVEFGYDAAGNRLWMTDGVGRVDYAYDTLSQLKSETRRFNGLSGSYALSYDYNLAGELKYVIDPTGNRIDYSYDEIGRMTGVTTPTPYGGVAQYATGIKYRAWGAVKKMNYGNGLSLSVGYNSRLQPANFRIPGVMSAEYHYITRYATADVNDNDGRIKFVRDSMQPDSKFDRAYKYDHVGRLTEALSGAEARGAGVADGPYRESNSYDVWDNPIVRTRRHWYDNYEATQAIMQTTNRNAGWTYDEAGRVTAMGSRQYKWDAAGRMAQMTEQVRGLHGVTSTRTLQRFYDGDGRWIKGVNNNTTIYQVRSSVLGGQVVTELNAGAQKVKTNVYAGARKVARQQGDRVVWEHLTPHDVNEWETTASGALSRRMELNPVGADVGVAPPPQETTLPEPVLAAYGDAAGFNNDVLVDGVAMPQFVARIYMNFGAGRSLRSGVGSGGGGTSEQWVDAWEDYYIAGDMNKWSEGGTTGSRNVGYFINVGGGVPATAITPQRTNPQNPAERVPGDVATDISDRIAKMLSNPDCSGFIDKLLNKAAQMNGVSAFDTNMMKLFGTIKGQGGLVYERLAGGINSIRGSVAGGDAQIILSPLNKLGRQFEENRVGTALTSLHETIHHAGPGIVNNVMVTGDFSLARAAYMLQNPTATGTPKFTITEASNFWHAALKAACAPKK